MHPGATQIRSDFNLKSVKQENIHHSDRYLNSLEKHPNSMAANLWTIVKKGKDQNSRFTLQVLDKQAVQLLISSYQWILTSDVS